jgi:hypothetical protein
MLSFRSALSAAAIVVSLHSWCARASACDISFPRALQVVADPSDNTPPSVPVVSVVGFRRGDENSPGCSDCESVPLLTLKVSSTDETSPASALGYEIVQTGGRPLESDKRVVLPEASGKLYLLFVGNDSGSDDFDLQVSAVDPAGNVSGSTIVHVRVDGDGCQIANTIPGGALWTTLMLLALVTRQHRCSRLKVPSPSPRS